MGISSLGAGSGILTQDVLDQLREADEASLIKPIEYDILNEQDKKDAYDVLDAKMTNLIDAIDELKSPLLFDERSVEVEGSSVSVKADANSDVQDFTLDVTQLATKQIEESGSYASVSDKIANGDGTMKLSIGDQDFTIEYTADTTLEDLKKSINEVAGDALNATIVQVSNGDYRLFLSSKETGSNQDISFTDNSANLSGTQLTNDLAAVQTGVNAEFTFNGQAITRSSNEIDDLVVGYDITLKELGKSEVSVEQNREEILSRIDSFVEKYNDAVIELGKLTKSSTDSKERGIFSGESSIKNLLATIQDSIGSVGGGVGTLYDYGFDVDKDGKMTVDKTLFEEKLDEDPKNVEAFFAGGDYTDADGNTTTVTGAFGEIATQIDSYTQRNGILDQYKDSLGEKLSSLEDRKTSMTERLDSKYEILKKQWAAYDLAINKLNSASNMFVQMANSQISSQNS
jgi:flagellar hook-associated protein 2